MQSVYLTVQHHLLDKKGEKITSLPLSGFSSPLTKLRFNQHQTQNYDCREIDHFKRPNKPLISSSSALFGIIEHVFTQVGQHSFHFQCIVMKLINNVTLNGMRVSVVISCYLHQSPLATIMTHFCLKSYL